MKNVLEVLVKPLKEERLTATDALLLFEEADLVSLGLAASQACRKHHSKRMATFIIDRNINYTNVCISQCKFCAFFRLEDNPQAYLLSKEDILTKIEEALELGATQIMLQGGLHPSLSIDYFIDLLKNIKERFSIHLHSFSPPEIVHISKVSDLSTKQVLQELREAGLDSLPGGGAEILSDKIRHHISPVKIESKLWLEVMEKAHSLGMPSTATMMFGSIENYNHRIEHLQKIRDLQDRTKGFTAFIPWTFQPGHTNLGGSSTTAADYLRTVAISRLFLDNIPNIQASWVTQGSKIGQIALTFGANDLGSTMIEENVVKATGVTHKMSREEMISAIKEVGMVPAQRNTLYEILEIFPK